MQYISSDRRGYKTKTNIIYSVKDNAFIHCDFLVVNSQKLVYRIYIKNYNYDDIFWKVMQMPTNSKKSNSLRASGALGLKFYSICTTIKIRVVVRIGG